MICVYSLRARKAIRFVPARMEELEELAGLDDRQGFSHACRGRTRSRKGDLFREVLVKDRSCRICKSATERSEAAEVAASNGFCGLGELCGQGHFTMD